jgi:peptidoglycan LD-endopeptidase LytH
VPFDTTRDQLYRFDFTENNSNLSPADIADTECFACWINKALQQNKARYGIGGYDEHRTLYARSKHFDRALAAAAEPSVGPATPLSPGRPSDSRGLAGEANRGLTGEANPGVASGGVAAEPRRLHLGVDIWGPAGTKVMAPLPGIVHSFAFNNNDSDYGATLILTHNLDGTGFHTLYGHISLNSIKNLYEGQGIAKGEVIAEFGMRYENGNWPPHLHFQLIADMQDWKGDYPGVCRLSERQQWLDNSPNPNLILQMGW